MSADSPRHSTGSRGIVAATVPPQVVSDRSILDSAIGFINDVTLTNQTHTDPKDTITWARFETAADISDPRYGEDWELEGNVAPPLLLMLGYGLGVQVWAIPANGEAIEVLSWRHGIVTALRLLPTPTTSSTAFETHGRADELIDIYTEKRPLIAIVDGSTSAGSQPQFCAVNFVSLKTGTQVKTIKFKNPVLDILANRSSIVITFHERIAVFDARTLEDRLSVTTCFPSPGINPNPVALGPRWLAYAEHKLLHSKRSGGGCDGEGVASYTATVLNAAKSLGKGLRELGEQVAAGLTGTTGSSCNSKSNSFDSQSGIDAKQPGVITILDIKHPIKDYSPTSGTPLSGQAGTDPIVAHFIAHSEAVVAMDFDNSGMLLVTADRRGHDFHIFRIQPHPVGSSLAAVNHLYVLHRGDTSAKVQNLAFSLDSRWVAVSTLRGTTHVFPITPYGGPMGVRTHTSLHVVNKLSRFHRSAGLSAEGRSNSPITHSESTTFTQSLQPYHNPTLPPFPRPTIVQPLAQLRQPSALGSPPGSAGLTINVGVGNVGSKTGSSGSTTSQRQRLSSLSDDNGKPLSVCAMFAKSRSWLLEPPNVTREASHRIQRKAVDSLFIMAGHGALIQYDLDTKLASNVAKEKICDDTPIELEVEAKAQWNLGRRREGSQDIMPPLSMDNWLIRHRNSCVLTDSTRHYDDVDERAESWLSQVEIITHAGPHRRLWMGPQFVFKTYNAPSGSNLNHVDSEAVEIGTAKASSAAALARSERSSPLSITGRSTVPVLIESGSYSSIEQSPKLMDRFRHDHLESDYAVAHGDTRLKEDLADAMRESPTVSSSQKNTGRLAPITSTTSAECDTTFYDALAEHEAFEHELHYPEQTYFDANRSHSSMASAVALASVLPNLSSYDTSSGYESFDSFRKTNPSIEKIVNPLGTVTTITAGMSAEVKTDLLDEVVSQLASEECVIHENCDEALFRPVVAIFCDENERKRGEEEAKRNEKYCQPPEVIDNKLIVPVIAKEVDAELSKKEKQKSAKSRQQQAQQQKKEQLVGFDQLGEGKTKIKPVAAARVFKPTEAEKEYKMKVVETVPKQSKEANLNVVSSKSGKPQVMEETKKTAIKSNAKFETDEVSETALNIKKQSNENQNFELPTKSGEIKAENLNVTDLADSLIEIEDVEKEAPEMLIAEPQTITLEKPIKKPETKQVTEAKEVTKKQESLKEEVGKKENKKSEQAKNKQKSEQHYKEAKKPITTTKELERGDNEKDKEKETLKEKMTNEETKDFEKEETKQKLKKEAIKKEIKGNSKEPLKKTENKEPVKDVIKSLEKDESKKIIKPAEEPIKADIKKTSKQELAAELVVEPEIELSKKETKKEEPKKESKKVEPSKEETKKEEPKKEIKKVEPSKEETKKEEPKKEFKKVEPSKEETKKEEPKKEIKKVEPSKEETNKEEPKKEIKKVEPSKEETKKEEPKKEFKKVEPSKEETKKEEPKKEIKKVEPSKEETNKEEPKKEIKKVEPNKEETKKEEPKKEIKKVEPNKEETKKEEPKKEIKKVDPSKVETKKEEPKKGIKKVEPGKEETQRDKPAKEELKKGESKKEEPKMEEPKMKEPKMEESKIEEPKMEELKMEKPKMEAPKKEAPKKIEVSPNTTTVSSKSSKKKKKSQSRPSSNSNSETEEVIEVTNMQKSKKTKQDERRSSQSSEGSCAELEQSFMENTSTKAKKNESMFLSFLQTEEKKPNKKLVPEAEKEDMKEIEKEGKDEEQKETESKTENELMNPKATIDSKLKMEDDEKQAKVPKEKSLNKSEEEYPQKVTSKGATKKEIIKLEESSLKEKHEIATEIPPIIPPRSPKKKVIETVDKDKIIIRNNSITVTSNSSPVKVITQQPTKSKNEISNLPESPTKKSTKPEEDVTDGLPKSKTTTTTTTSRTLDSPPKFNTPPQPPTSPWKMLSGADLINRNRENLKSEKSENFAFPSLGKETKQTKKPTAVDSSEKLLPDLSTPMHIKSTASELKPMPTKMNDINKKSNKTTLGVFPMLSPLESLPPLPTLGPLEIPETTASLLSDQISLITFESPQQEHKNLARKITPPAFEQNLIFALCGSLHAEDEEDLSMPALPDLDELPFSVPTTSLEIIKPPKKSTNSYAEKCLSSSPCSSASEEIIVLEEKKMSKKQKRKRQQHLQEKQQNSELKTEENELDEELRPLIDGSMVDSQMYMDTMTSSEHFGISNMNSSSTTQFLEIPTSSTTTDSSEGPMPATTSDDNVFVMPTAKTSNAPNKVKTKKLEHKFNLYAAIEAATSTSNSSAEESGVEGGGGRASDNDITTYHNHHHHHTLHTPLAANSLIGSTSSAVGGAMLTLPTSLSVSAQLGATKKKTKRRFNFSNYNSNNVDVVDFGSKNNKLNKIDDKNQQQQQQNQQQTLKNNKKQFNSFDSSISTTTANKRISSIKNSEKMLNHHNMNEHEQSTIVNIDIFEDQLSTSSISNHSRQSLDAHTSSSSPPNSLNGIIDTNLMHFPAGGDSVDDVRGLDDIDSVADGASL